MKIKPLSLVAGLIVGLVLSVAPLPAHASSLPAPSPGYRVTARDTATVITLAKKKFPEIKSTPSRCMRLAAPQVQGSPYVLTIETSAMLDSECGAWNEFAFQGGIEADKVRVKGKRVWKVLGREDVVVQGDEPVALTPR